jgi:PAT family beta-lactamase induction signal transducer AmpG
VGALVGGGLVARLRIRRSLLLFGVLQAGANVGYMALAVVGKSHLLLVAAIGVDQFCGGLGTAAFVAFLMSLCNHRFSVTQYALLSSASSLVGKLLATVSGSFVEAFGWVPFFGVSIAAALPALGILLVLPEEAAVAPAAPAAQGASG